MPQHVRAPRRSLPAALVAIALAVPALAASTAAASPASADPVTYDPVTSGPVTSGPGTYGPVTSGPGTSGPGTSAPRLHAAAQPGIADRPAPVVLRRGTRPVPSVPGGAAVITPGALSFVPGVAGPPVSRWQVTYTGFESNPQAKLAFQKAVDVWAGIVRSSVPIKVSATFEDLGDPNVLGATGPGYLFEVGQGGTLYPSALADAVSGVDQAAQYADSSGTADILSSFNSTAGGVYYGTDGRPAPGQVDFETIVLHELGHGLGFLGSADVTEAADKQKIGSYLVPPTPFDRLTLGPGGAPILGRPNDSAELASVLQSNDVTWGGATGTRNNGGRRPQLYAPSPFQPGSSIAHLDEASYPPGSPDSLMTPLLDEREVVRSPGLVTLGVLADQGWSVAYPTGGAIGARWLALGGPGSVLGWALGAEYDVPGGRAQDFAGGRIYWSARTGAHEVHGAILGRYLAAGGPAGVLGLPDNDELAVPGGTAGTFTGGHVYWSGRTGAVMVRGAVLGRYLGEKGSFGRLGLPQEEEKGVAGGVRQRFGGGNVYWGSTTGAQVVEGAILGVYLGHGESAGVLGLPVAGEEGVPGGRVSRFTGGHVYWGSATGAHEVHGAILGRYLAVGGPAVLGLPNGDERTAGSGRVSTFTRGNVYWSAVTDAHAVMGAILGRYLSLGGATSPLGLPVSEEYGVPGGRRSDFRTAGLVWISATNQVVQVAR